MNVRRDRDKLGDAFLTALMSLFFLMQEAYGSMQFCECRVTRDYHCLYEVMLRLSVGTFNDQQSGSRKRHHLFFSLLAPPLHPVAYSSLMQLLSLFIILRETFFSPPFPSPLTAFSTCSLLLPHSRRPSRRRLHKVSYPRF